MAGLSRRDYRGMLDFVAFIGEAAELDEFASRVAVGLDAVIPCHASSYNEINLLRQRARWVTELETGPQHIAAFEHHLSANPIITHFSRHPGAPAVLMSDFVGDREWRSLGVYSDLYRPLDCERILAIEVSGEPISVAVALFRDHSDFTERERTMVTLLRPHLLNAYRNACALTDLGQRLALLENGLDDGGLGAIALRSDDSVQSSTDAARRLLTLWFGQTGGDRLPEAVTEWLRQHAMPGSAEETALPAGPPLVLERGSIRLTARLIRHGSLRLILLREQRTTWQAADLAPLGLAPREAEVLAWVASGKTDPEIAVLLSLSPRTVSHTLERVYRKLGVETRTAAAMRVSDLQRGE